jgi:hypothetical protein
MESWNCDHRSELDARPASRRGPSVGDQEALFGGWRRRELFKHLEWVRWMLLIATLIPASSARAVDFSGVPRVYQEVYDDLAFPTNPEVDLAGMGGLHYWFVSSVAPFLTGTDAHISTSDGQYGTQLWPGLLGTADVGIRGGYANLTVSSDGGAMVRQAFFFSSQFTSLLAELYVRFVGGVAVAASLIVEEDSEYSSANYDFVPLSPGAALAIGNGGPFSMDLWLDRTASTLTASIEVPGEGSFTTASIPLFSIGAGDSIGQIWQLGNHYDAVGMEADLTDLEVYAPMTEFTISDDKFSPPDWETTVLFQTGCALPATDLQESTGGNPDAYREMQHPFACAGGQQRVYHEYSRVAFDLSTLPPGEKFQVLDYEEDRVVIAPPIAGAAVNMSPALRQDGIIYTHNSNNFFTNTSWAGLQLSDLRESDFLEWNGSAQPDFSETGPPVHVGFIRFTGGTGNNTLRHGVDNWSVTTNAVGVPVPEPGAALALFSGVAAIMAARSVRGMRRSGR